MKLPQRVPQHISETKSFKIFKNHIPDNWIIREISERDYGIDCYIELVNKDNELTGNLVSIQLKSRENIKWNINNETSINNIAISTTNYWFNFSVPVFLFLINNKTQSIYFISINDFIRNSFLKYADQTKFKYIINNKLVFNKKNIRLFIRQYFHEKYRTLFEANLITFVSNINSYKEFIDNNIGRDSFMGVEWMRETYANHLYNNIKFLHNYLGLNWNLKEFSEYKNISQAKYGDEYNLYEDELSEILTKIGPTLLNVILKLKDIVVQKEMEYWYLRDKTLYHLLLNCNNKGEIADY